MFELNDAIIDELLFAMENQALDFMVDGESGTIVMMGDDTLDSGYSSLENGSDLLDPPRWTSVDGFALMESFASGVGDPLARNELHAALTRGRGVFRAFKTSLESYPDMERRWFDFKRGSMAKRIQAWYDEARIARGLERLGPEPEEADDLLAEAFSFRLAGRDAWPECIALFRQGLEEASSSFPEPLVEYEYTRIEREISEGGHEGLILAIAEAIGGAVAGIAAARKVFVSDSSFGKLVYLYVAPEHRRLGLGRRLAEATRTRLAKDGIPRFIVDMAFVPDGFGASMTAYGYESFGTRYLKTSD